VGVPPWIVGVFERMMAYLLFFFFESWGDCSALLAAWIGLKLASNWQRRPLTGRPITPEQEREIRIQSLVALMAGIISVAIGAGAGALARSKPEAWSWIVGWC
jgi:hypothetical protein